MHPKWVLFCVVFPIQGTLVAFGSDIAYAVILSSTVILRCSDICLYGKLRIYLNFGWKPKYNFGDSQNITLTKTKYNLRSKYNRTSEPARR